MTPRLSAGLLPWRRRADGSLEVLLVHPGGPFFARKDAGSWSIAKGLVEPDEAGLVAARREFEEETGVAPEADDFVQLGEVVQKGGKRVRAWAFEAPELDADAIRSNTFEIEWPRGSGERRRFPEIDRAAWLGLEEARERLLAEQGPFLDRLVAALDGTE